MQSKTNVEIVKWFKKAAEQGHAEASYELGWMYYEGEGGEKDYVEAAKWYHKAAEQGHAETQYYLGEMYRKGKGVEQDDVETVTWLRKAAGTGTCEGPVPAWQDVLPGQGRGERLHRGSGVVQKSR